MTAVNNTVLTAAQWNAQVRDNLLESATAKVTGTGQLVVTAGPNQLIARQPLNAFISTSEATTSTSFGDLTTIGPAVTVTTGVSAIVFIVAQLTQVNFQMYALASYEVSGATSQPANSGTSINFRSSRGNTFPQLFRACYADYNYQLTPGVNTFTMKYAAGGGGTATFASRSLFVIPL